jgi:putative endonuclease
MGDAELDCFVAALLAMTEGGDGTRKRHCERSEAIQCSADLPTEPRVKQPAVYIMANRRNGTLYTGVTSDLVRRAWQHREGTIGFTARYKCKLLVWYEIHETMESAILREKQIKAGSRKKKLALIEQMNADWADLFDSIV